MKKLLIVISIVTLAIFGVLILKNRSTTPEKSFGKTQTNSLPPSSNNFTSFDFDNQNLTIAWFKIDNPEKLKLIPNFSEKSSSKETISAQNCQFLSNAGFYTTTNLPIGLFIADGKQISSWQQNSLFDGILSINYLATPRITRTFPQDPLKSAVQSGPIIKENAGFQTLRIQNDNNSRRVAAGITGENILYFLVIYDSNSNYSGPLLANLPDVLKIFEEKEGIIFADIINLDGGGASAFISPDTSLTEINPVGAFFCQP